MNNLVIRSLRTGETELFQSLPHQIVPGVGFESRRHYPDFVTTGQYRPDWTWVALRDGIVVARCAFWGFPDATHPMSLDWFEPGAEPDRLHLGAQLLRVALAQMTTAEGERPEYHLCLPPGWRDQPEARAAAQDRITAAGQAGYEPFIERLSFEWTPPDGLPPRSLRLVFRAVSDEEALDVIRQSCEGTLDGYTARDVKRHGPAEAAQVMLRVLAEFPSPRDWWRLAHTLDGQPVGLIVPVRNHAIAAVGFLSVLPAQRGQGYADDLLAETTHVLVEHGADRIGADTDLGNHPMAAAFARIGFRNTAIRVVMQ